jgi:phosphatidylserine/phosphatidylglycerophosphate/cardiolipin synthase-like enzyme
MFTFNASTIRKMQTPISKNESLIGAQYASRLLELINEAEKSIDIMMYEWRWYENDPGHPIQILNQALVRAVRRGVRVRALTFRGTITAKLREIGIDAKAWKLSKLMHSKMIIFDSEVVVMGSHNFTGSAIQSNIETSVLFFDEEVAKIKTDYFQNLCRL